jgi:hypothetical protein
MMFQILVLAGKSISYKDYPEWATYLAFFIIAFVVYLLWKGRKKI